MPEPVRYKVVVSAPHTHEVEVEARFPPLPGGRFDLSLPVWTPGSYLVRDFARHLRDLSARDGRGRPLAAVKVAKSTWRIEGARGPLSVRYRVYANERSVRTSHVTSHHAFLSPPTLFLFAAEQRARPCEVAVAAPRAWRVASALPLTRGRWQARDYDHLIDSPFECGRHRTIRFTVKGTPFRVLLCGTGNYDASRLRRDLARIAGAERGLFGSFPFPSYLAILNLTPGSRGGLEHRASTALEWPRFRFRDPERYEDFLALFAHELFHAWNVKEAVPLALKPLDYLREMPTRLLWWFEGATDYYDELLLRRAGLLTPRAYLDRLLGRWERLVQSPGRRRTSVADASFDAWIKYYRPDEDSANSSISYYEKGHLVAALLDLEIRKRSAGKKSLDDVARQVVREGGRGIPEEGIRRIVERVSGADFAGWFARYVHGTAELPFASALAEAGLRMLPKEPKKESGGWLGATLKSAAGKLTLASVVAGGPAARAGLSALDEVVAMDGVRIDEESLRERLAERAPGDRVRVTLFRDDLLEEIEVRLGKPPASRRIVAVKRPSAAQGDLLRAWLGAAHGELGGLEPPRSEPVRSRTKRPR